MTKEFYFDNSATSNPKPKNVIEKVFESLTLFNANSGRSGSKKSIDASREIHNVRLKIANFFNIKSPLQIAFTANSTESLNFAIKGLNLENVHIITTVLEHNSVLRPLFSLEEEKNVGISFLEPKDDIFELKKELFSLITENTKVVIINHISNLTGYIMDIYEIGKICREKNLIFIVDASQSAGFFPIDVEKFNIDILCFTGHKSLFGIQGIGGIYVSEKILLEPLLEGGTGSFSKMKRQPKVMPELLESGTLNTPGILSLGAGIDFINSIGLSEIKEHEDFLTKTFLKGIKNIKNIIIYGNDDFENVNRGPVVALNIKGIASSELASILNDEYNISTRSGFHCAPLAHKYYKTYEIGSVRFSFSYFNTLEDVKFAISSLKEISTFIEEKK